MQVVLFTLKNRVRLEVNLHVQVAGWATVDAMFAFAGLQLATTQRFQLVAGFTPMQAGILGSLAAIGSLPTAMLGGAFLHRIGLRILIAGGLAVATVGVLIATLGISHGIGWLIAGSVLAGAGVGAAMSVASTAIVGNAPVKNAGMAASVEEITPVRIGSSSPMSRLSMSTRA